MHSKVRSKGSAPKHELRSGKSARLAPSLSKDAFTRRVSDFAEKPVRGEGVAST